MANCLEIVVFYLLITFCNLFTLVGGGVIGLGFYLLQQTKNYYPVFLTDGYIIANYFLIAVGGFIVAISCIGLLGSWCAKYKNNQSMIRFFIFILVNILIFELFAAFSEIQNDVKSNMEKTLIEYHNKMEYRTLYPRDGPIIAAFNNTDITEEFSSADTLSTQTPNSIDGLTNMNTSRSIDYKQAWDYLQEKFQCCGINDKDDWINMINISPPQSCFDKKDGNNTYNIGCFDAIIHRFFPVINAIPRSENTLLDWNIVTGFAVFIANLQFLGILFCLCFGCYFGTSTDRDTNTISDKIEDYTELDCEEIEEPIQDGKIFGERNI